MTRAQRAAYKLRFVLLLLALACFGVWVWWLWVKPLTDDGAGVFGTPVMWGWFVADHLGLRGSPGWSIAMINLPVIGLVLLAQWLLLRPSRGWLPRMSRTQRPMRTSVIGAAFFAMLLTTGAVLTLMELRGWWALVFEQDSAAWFWATSGVMLIVWAIWAAIFFVYWRQGDRYTQLGRMIRGLIAGSVAEMLVATGVFAWNPQNEDCYCARGSYSGLVLGGTVLVWAFGPGVVLLFLREKHRRLTAQRLCASCGYDLRGSVGVSKSCPECGTPLN